MHTDTHTSWNQETHRGNIKKNIKNNITETIAHSGLILGHQFCFTLKNMNHDSGAQFNMPLDSYISCLKRIFPWCQHMIPSWCWSYIRACRTAWDHEHSDHNHALITVFTSCESLVLCFNNVIKCSQESRNRKYQDKLNQLHVLASGPKHWLLFAPHYSMVFQIRTRQKQQSHFTNYT